MREVIRDPAKTFRCPRCGAPVTYKGRGRRPVWCSAHCRVEASIERRGNEIVGVKPEVVKVVSPTARLSDWEKERRQEIEASIATRSSRWSRAGPNCSCGCWPASKNKG
jgi:DNA-directed RNA polymerase subunit RPC12/RpoP